MEYKEILTLQHQAFKNVAFHPVGSRLQKYEPSAKQALNPWEVQRWQRAAPANQTDTNGLKEPKMSNDLSDPRTWGNSNSASHAGKPSRCFHVLTIIAIFFQTDLDYFTPILSISDLPQDWQHLKEKEKKQFQHWRPNHGTVTDSSHVG